ncbi:hypothetical protein FOTG_15243 [Fusarium oxysporum f. sp. vasinfectum 25433]|uniref:Uncharacterized protein n=1 Tax=Fusarium oxysporum f. sp. vasinfectum 25433 TaxID=1089449 RepID=X0L608_FUSOX|nr:hypothetical protein FOTG_15243 [Fusarium oxysporum f. sp. vasinfectum 25433]
MYTGVPRLSIQPWKSTRPRSFSILTIRSPLTRCLSQKELYSTLMPKNTIRHACLTHARSFLTISAIGLTTPTPKQYTGLTVWRELESRPSPELLHIRDRGEVILVPASSSREERWTEGT